MKNLIKSLMIAVVLVVSGCTTDIEPIDPALEVPGNNIDDACELAIAAAEAAAANFDAADDVNYEAACIAYKAALELQKQECGDDDGSIQGTIDLLADCDPATQPDPCALARQATTQAQNTFDNATPANYTQRCNTLKQRLEDQILECGDADGALQDRIDALGNCQQAQGNPCTDAEDESDMAETAFNNATAANYTQLCNAFKQALQNEINECGDPNGDIQAEIDALGNCQQGGGGGGGTGNVSFTYGGTNYVLTDNVSITVQGNGDYEINAEDTATNIEYVGFFTPGVGRNKAQLAEIIDNGEDYGNDFATYSDDITTDDGVDYIGTFSGDFRSRVDGSLITITNGSINVQF